MLRSGKPDLYSFLGDYVRYLVRDAKASSGTVNCYVAGVKRILRFASIKIDNFEFNERVALPPDYVQTRDRIPTKEELRRMLGVTDSRGRALVSMLASSGMRIGELLSVQVKDVEFGHPTRIRIKAENTKNRTERIAFISDEATGFLKDYLVERINAPESCLFLGNWGVPLTYEAAFYLFARILEQSGTETRQCIDVNHASFCGGIR